MPITGTSGMLEEQGRKLFYDKSLSINSTVSCASCHQQQFGFSDPQQLSKGVSGKAQLNSMSLVNNFAGIERQFWNGRSPNLAHQVLQPIQDSTEMGLALNKLEQRTRVSAAEISNALEAFVLSIRAPANRPKSAAAMRGKNVYFRPLTVVVVVGVLDVILPNVVIAISQPLKWLKMDYLVLSLRFLRWWELV